MKMIGRFAKRDTMRYISHLDILRTMARAMSRADIPVRFSQGFHPHAQFSFAQAAQMGMESEYEVIDIKLEQPMAAEDFLPRMKAALPPFLPFLDAAAVDDAAPSAMAICAAGEYLALPLEEGIAPLLERFLLLEECLVPKKTKKGEKLLDIRPLVRALEMREGQVHMTLALQEGRAVRPDMLFGALSTLAGRDFTIKKLCRIGLFAEGMKDMMEYYRDGSFR